MTQDRIPKFIKAAAADPEQNPHRLTAKQVCNRYYNRKWPLSECLATPILTRSQAARRGAKKSNWSKWEPGKFSAKDKAERGNEKI